MPRLLWCVLVLALICVTDVSSRPSRKSDYAHLAGRRVSGRVSSERKVSGSIDDGGQAALALEEFDLGDRGQAEEFRGSRHEYAGPTGSRDYDGGKQTEFSGPVFKKHKSHAGKTNSQDQKHAAPKDSTSHKTKTSKTRPKARPAKVRPHPKGKISINGKEEPEIITHGKVHSCKSGGFQWDKCNTVSHNLKCEICFPKVPLKFEFCQESHRGNSKRCLEALYWMFKQKVNSVKRRFPHWRDRQATGHEVKAGSGSQRSRSGDRGHGHRRKGDNSRPEFFRGDNRYYDQTGYKYGNGIRKRV